MYGFLQCKTAFALKEQHILKENEIPADPDIRNYNE